MAEPKKNAHALNRSQEIATECQRRLDSGEIVDLKEVLSQYAELEEYLKPLLDEIDWERIDEGHDDDAQVLGEFRIIREIGRGGMGCVVFEAEQLSLKRKVALKVLPSHLSYSDSAVIKFWREAQAGARQKHPNIVSVIAQGEHEGAYYIAQELIENGYSLADRIEELASAGGPSPGHFRDAALFLRETAEALHHIHDAGVVHRDIKPSNILITPEGRPKITDFGLAKMEGTAHLSQSGIPAGTPYYMSPEQAEGHRGSVDHRSDVFSLGVTMYEMLTFERPFEGETSQEILRKIIHTEPRNPQGVNPRVPTDLAVICLKAMEKRAASRYDSMQAFADDLNRYLLGDVILARPVGAGARFMKRVRRNPVLSTAIGIAGVALLAWCILGPIFYFNAKSAQANAERQYEEITQLSDVKRISQYLAEADISWPTVPENISEMEAWIDKAEKLLQNYDRYRARLDAVREEALPYSVDDERDDAYRLSARRDMDLLTDTRRMFSAKLAAIETGVIDPVQGEFQDQPVETVTAEIEGIIAELDGKIAACDAEAKKSFCRRTWRFTDIELQWRHDLLEELVLNCGSLAGSKLSEVKSRLERARTVSHDSFEAPQDKWQEAIKSIGDRNESPQYDGLRLKPQIGFVPIGKDSESGLWEFVQIHSGEIPERDQDGKLVLTEKAGFVFVLIPGGEFMMGAELPPESGANDPTDSRRFTRPIELPRHKVTVDHFFLSKYEMTQAQWVRITGSNPSEYNPEVELDKSPTLLHPVERMRWVEGEVVLSSCGLRYPSEAEWEYAARAGTTSVWWTGDTVATLQGAANILDRHYMEFDFQETFAYELDLDDGYVVHAPVGSFRANSFGLHDMLGNVFEFCQDNWHNRYWGAPDDGAAWEVVNNPDRVIRGGGWNQNSLVCRSSYRTNIKDDYATSAAGLRPACTLRED